MRLTLIAGLTGLRSSIGSGCFKMMPDHTSSGVLYSHDRIEIALASMSYRPSPTVPLPQRFSVFISPMHGVQKFTFCVSDFDSLSHCLLGRYSRFTLNNYLSLYYQLIHPILLRNLFECARQYSALYREPYCSQQRQQCEYNLRLRYKD